MKLHRLAALGVLGVSMTAAAFTPPSSVKSTSIAGPSSTAQSQGAVVIKNAPCGIAVPGDGIVPASRSHTVITPSGNAALSCHADTNTALAKTVVVRNSFCLVPGVGLSANSQIVATRSGQVLLWCHIHPRAHGKAGVNGKSGLNAEADEHRWQHGANAGTGPVKH
jgi:hypothetical protein